MCRGQCLMSICKPSLNESEGVVKVLYKAYSGNLRVGSEWITGYQCFANFIDNYFENCLESLCQKNIIQALRSTNFN